MTALSHLDKDFENVWGIQAINEPIMDATLTPGYGDCKPRSLDTLGKNSFDILFCSPEELCSRHSGC